MAYAPSFKCDVFISFATLDDAAVGGALPWISAFVGDLKTRLRSRLGVRESDDGLKIYFTGHKKVGLGLNLDDELRENAASSAVFVAVTSPGYVVEDTYTMRELAAFQQAKREGSRIFVVEYSPLDSDDEYPAGLREPTRIEFWKKHPEREIPVPMALGSEIYMVTLCDLVEQIRRHLKTLRRAAGTAADGQPAPIAQAVRASLAAGEGGRTIFLAQSTDDLDEERDQVRRYVEQFGIRVLPERVYPQGGTDFTAALEADLASADIFVQLLGRVAAKRPPDLAQGYDRLQYERAAARALPLLQWLRPEVDPAAVADPQHAGLLSGEHVMRTGFEAFKAEVVRRTEKPAPVRPPEANSDAQRFIFINADASDLKIAEDLRREFQNANFAAAVPALEGSAEEVRLDLEANIIDCDALVMVYGHATPIWVRGQLRTYSKLKHRRREPVKVLALYLDSPKPDFGMDMPEIRRIEYREGMAAEGVRQFLTDLRQ